jgi:hypothetical protein
MGHPLETGCASDEAALYDRGMKPPDTITASEIAS